jgi:hypothetical protein
MKAVREIKDEKEGLPTTQAQYPQKIQLQYPQTMQTQYKV